jgi:hypothetical protein
MKKLLLSVSCFLITSNGWSATVTIDFSSLPSAQGWSYVAAGNNVPETSVFSLDNGILKQNTIGVGYGDFNGSNRYALESVVDTIRPFTLEVRARVPIEEPATPPNSYGFSFGLFTGTEQFAVGIGPNKIEDVHLNTITTSIDNTVFHDYKLIGTPGVGWRLFVDNVLIGSGVSRSIAFPNGLFLGDGTGETNAMAEITSFSYTVVPIPSAMILFISGIGGISFLFSSRRFFQRNMKSC